MINNIDIEGLAVGYLKTLFSKIGCVRAVINDKDKEPIWDGNIYVYRYNTQYCSNKDFEGRIPIQVKGRIKKDIYVDNSKIPLYKFEVTNLKNYLKDGGVLFFVVSFDENGNNEKVFYKKLLPYDLNRILKNVGNKKSKVLTLDFLPENKEKIIELFLNFINDKKKQKMTLDNIVFSDIIGKHKNIVLSFVTINKDYKYVFDYMLNHDLYIYTKLEFGNLFPIEHIKNVSEVSQVVNADVTIRGNVYYNKIEMVFLPANNREVRIGKSLIIRANVEEETQKLTFKLAGTLSNEIDDLNFMINAVKNKGFYINENLFDFNQTDINKTSGFNLIEMEKYLSELYRIKELLEYSNISEELNLDEITTKDFLNLKELADGILDNKLIGLNVTNTGLGIFNISNLKILILAIQDKKTNKFQIYNYYDCPVPVKMKNNETNEDWECPIFLVLTKENLKSISNLNENFIIKTLKGITFTPNISAQVSHFLLNILNAYDESDGKNKNLLTLSKEIIDIIQMRDTYIPKIYLILNKLQIIKRERALTNKERYNLNELIKNNSNDNFFLTGAYIILDEYYTAEQHLKKLTDGQQKEFITYPIYKFLKNYKEANNEQTEV